MASAISLFSDVTIMSHHCVQTGVVGRGACFRAHQWVVCGSVHVEIVLNRPMSQTHRCPVLVIQAVALWRRAG